MRLISFAKTLDKMYPAVTLQIAKTETRRLGFWNEALDVPRLDVGEICWAVEKSQGIKRGEKVKRIWPIVITNVDREPLRAITQEGVIREGFHTLVPSQFIEFFMNIHKSKRITPETLVTIIKFDYVVYRGKDIQFDIPRKSHATSFKQIYEAIKEESGETDLTREYYYNYWIAENFGISDIEFDKYQQARRKD